LSIAIINTDDLTEMAYESIVIANAIKIPIERVEQAILLIRGQKVMLDADLAVLYEVPTKALNQAVKRNERRFPPDFMFRLTKKRKE